VTVNVVDNDPPTPTCPTAPAGDLLITSNTATASASFVGSATDHQTTPTLKYNLSGATSGSINGGSVSIAFNIGTTHVTFTASDGTNTVPCPSFDVVVKDNFGPTLTCPPSVSLLTGPDNDFGLLASAVTAAAIDNSGGAVTISNTCSGSSATIPAGSVTFPGKTCTFTATDLDGNSNTCDFTVTVDDLVKPTFDKVGDDDCSDGSMAVTLTLSSGDTIHDYVPVAHDNVANPVDVTPTYDAVWGQANVFDFVANDHNANAGNNNLGNSAACTVTVTVVDTIHPTFDIAPDRNDYKRDCTTGGPQLPLYSTVSFTVSNLDDNLGVPDVTFGGCTAGQTISGATTYTCGAFTAAGDYKQEFFVTDAGGLESDHECFGFTIVAPPPPPPDTTDPTIDSVESNTNPPLTPHDTCTASTTADELPVGTTVNVWVTASDNSGPPTVTNDFNTNDMGCSVKNGDDLTCNPPEGTYTITFTATDGAGNTASKCVKFHINPAAPPPPDVDPCDAAHNPCLNNGVCHGVPAPNPAEPTCDCTAIAFDGEYCGHPSDAPTVSIDGPAQVDVCSAFTIKTATTSAKGSLKFTWSSTPAWDFLAAQTGGQVDLTQGSTHGEPSPATYHISVTVEDQVHKTATASYTLVVSSSSSGDPTFTLDLDATYPFTDVSGVRLYRPATIGGPRSASPKSQLLITAGVLPSQCGAGLDQADYAFVVKNENGNTISSPGLVRNGNQLTVQPFTLEGRPHSYTITVTTTAYLTGGAVHIQDVSKSFQLDLALPTANLIPDLNIVPISPTLDPEDPAYPANPYYTIHNTPTCPDSDHPNSYGHVEVLWACVQGSATCPKFTDFGFVFHSSFSLPGGGAGTELAWYKNPTNPTQLKLHRQHLPTFSVWHYFIRIRQTDVPTSETDYTAYAFGDYATKEPAGDGTWLCAPNRLYCDDPIWASSHLPSCNPDNTCLFETFASRFATSSVKPELQGASAADMFTCRWTEATGKLPFLNDLTSCSLGFEARDPRLQPNTHYTICVTILQNGAPVSNEDCSDFFTEYNPATSSDPTPVAVTVDSTVMPPKVNVEMRGWSNPNSALTYVYKYIRAGTTDEIAITSSTSPLTALYLPPGDLTLVVYVINNDNGVDVRVTQDLSIPMPSVDVRCAALASFEGDLTRALKLSQNAVAFQLVSSLSRAIHGLDLSGSIMCGGVERGDDIRALPGKLRGQLQLLASTGTTDATKASTFADALEGMSDPNPTTTDITTTLDVVDTIIVALKKDTTQIGSARFSGASALFNTLADLLNSGDCSSISDIKTRLAQVISLLMQDRTPGHAPMVFSNPYLDVTAKRAFANSAMSLQTADLLSVSLPASALRFQSEKQLDVVISRFNAPKMRACRVASSDASKTHLQGDIASSVVDVEVQTKAGVAVPVSDLQTAAVVSIPTDQHCGTVCGWWDADASAWSAQGCTTTATETGVVCSCDHLAEFAAVGKCDESAAGVSGAGYGVAVAVYGAGAVAATGFGALFAMRKVSDRVMLCALVVFAFVCRLVVALSKIDAVSANETAVNVISIVPFAISFFVNARLFERARVQMAVPMPFKFSSLFNCAYLFYAGIALILVATVETAFKSDVTTIALRVAAAVSVAMSLAFFAHSLSIHGKAEAVLARSSLLVALASVASAIAWLAWLSQGAAVAAFVAFDLIWAGSLVYLHSRSEKAAPAVPAKSPAVPEAPTQVPAETA